MQCKRSEKMKSCFVGLLCSFVAQAQLPSRLLDYYLAILLV